MGVVQSRESVRIKYVCVGYVGMWKGRNKHRQVRGDIAEDQQESRSMGFGGLEANPWKNGGMKG